MLLDTKGLLEYCEGKVTCSDAITFISDLENNPSCNGGSILWMKLDDWMVTDDPRFKSRKEYSYTAVVTKSGTLAYNVCEDVKVHQNIDLVDGDYTYLDLLAPDLKDIKIEKYHSRAQEVCQSPNVTVELDRWTARLPLLIENNDTVVRAIKIKLYAELPAPHKHKDGDDEYEYTWKIDSDTEPFIVVTLTCCKLASLDRVLEGQGQGQVSEQESSYSSAFWVSVLILTTSLVVSLTVPFARS